MIINAVVSAWHLHGGRMDKKVFLNDKTSLTITVETLWGQDTDAAMNFLLDNQGKCIPVTITIIPNEKLSYTIHEIMGE